MKNCSGPHACTKSSGPRPPYAPKRPQATSRARLTRAFLPTSFAHRRRHREESAGRLLCCPQSSPASPVSNFVPRVRHQRGTWDVDRLCPQARFGCVRIDVGTDASYGLPPSAGHPAQQFPSVASKPPRLPVEARCRILATLCRCGHHGQQGRILDRSPTRSPHRGPNVQSVLVAGPVAGRTDAPPGRTSRSRPHAFVGVGSGERQRSPLNTAQ